MKAIQIHILLFFVAAFFCACTDEDEPQPEPTTPTSPKNDGPRIEILLPDGIASVNDDNTISLHILFSDEIEMTSAKISLSSGDESYAYDVQNGGVFYNENFELSGLKDEIEITAPLPNVNMLDKRRVHVSAKNSNGVIGFTDQLFDLVDHEDPILKVNEFYSDYKGNQGNPHTKFDFEVSDNYGIKRVKWKINQTDFKGDPVKELYGQNEVFHDLTKSFVYNKTTSPLNKDSLEYYHGVIEVVDEGGNVVTYTSEVMQFQ